MPQVAGATPPPRDEIIGKWKVKFVHGVAELAIGDIVEFTGEGVLITYFKKPFNGELELKQPFGIRGRILEVPSGRLHVNFRIVDRRLLLNTPDGVVDVVMTRAGIVTLG
ncbi:MAG: hypothetical protein WBO17_05135 [Sphingorhabdus sp.]